HGARAGDADPGDHRRARLHRLVHELAHRGPARRGARRRGAPRPPRRAGDGRARLRDREAARRGRGARPRVRRRGLRVATSRLLDVPRHEPGHAVAGRALRVDVQPELRGAPGRRGAHAPRLARGRGGDRDPRPFRGGARPRRSARVKAFRRVTSPAVVLDRGDVDTDQIIPKQFLKRIERSGFGEFLFFDWMKDPGFELHRQQGSILLAGRNFGCGSSREHAPWALQDYGFDVVIAPSFGDIFRQNSLKIGLLPVQLPAEQVKDLMARARAGEELTVDLEERTAGGFPFELDNHARECLLEGLDDVALTLREDDAISAYESSHPARVSTLSV